MLVNRKREIRKFADSFRGKCKVGRYGIIDLFKECERCGYKLVRYPLGNDGDLGEVYAISLAQTLGAYSLVTNDTKQGGPYMSLLQFEDDIMPLPKD